MFVIHDDRIKRLYVLPLFSDKECNQMFLDVLLLRKPEKGGHVDSFPAKDATRIRCRHFHNTMLHLKAKNAHFKIINYLSM